MAYLKSQTENLPQQNLTGGLEKGKKGEKKLHTSGTEMSTDDILDT